MSQNIFICGCARSGMGLLARNMRAFTDIYVAPRAGSAASFADLPQHKGSISMKRNAAAFETLPDLPADVGLIYMTRHPFDVLTSVHPGHDRKGKPHPYYVSRKRWLEEYDALDELRRRQPDRDILFIRYEDLVSDPDGVQQQIADRFGLRQRVPFSRHEDFLSTYIAKWRTDPRMRAYILSFPPFFTRHVKRFAQDFGYSPSFANVRAAEAETAGRQ